MTIEEFTTAAARIYGQRWQGPLAAALGVNTRTVRLWLIRQAGDSGGYSNQRYGLTGDCDGSATGTEGMMEALEFRIMLRQLGVRQRHLAERLGISANTVNRWANGGLVVPRYVVAYLELLRYARSLEASQGIAAE